jgi:hypothetical protein
MRMHVSLTNRPLCDKHMCPLMSISTIFDDDNQLKLQVVSTVTQYIGREQHLQVAVNSVHSTLQLVAVC